MSNEWIIDVMADVREFAQKHAMHALAERLDDAIFVAACEIDRSAHGQNGDGGEPTGAVPRTAGAD